MIYIRTYSYNAEKTLSRAVDSVLRQTHSDWVYYLCDNGSTDDTGKIVDLYAKKDSRIRPFHNIVNRAYQETPTVLNLPYNIGEDDFFCILDADDEYLPTFLADMLAFINTHNLDIAVCGSNFLDAANNMLLGKRVLPADLVLRGADFGIQFPIYHQFMRARWAKLYRRRILLNTVEDPKSDPTFPGAYGGDTYNVFLSLRDACKAGILAKTLHNYYISPQSGSYRWNHKRIESDITLYNQALDFLKEKVGVVSARNQQFILLVYMNALNDTLKVLMGSEISEGGKINALCEMFLCDSARSLAASEQFGALIGDAMTFTKQRKELFAGVTQWLLDREEINDEQVENFCELGEFLCAACENGDGWIFFNKLLIKFLFDAGRNDEGKVKRDELLAFLPDDSELQYL